MLRAVSDNGRYENLQEYSLVLRGDDFSVISSSVFDVGDVITINGIKYKAYSKTGNRLFLLFAYFDTLLAPISQVSEKSYDLKTLLNNELTNLVKVDFSQNYTISVYNKLVKIDKLALLQFLANYFYIAFKPDVIYITDTPENPSRKIDIYDIQIQEANRIVTSAFFSLKGVSPKTTYLKTFIYEDITDSNTIRVQGYNTTYDIFVSKIYKKPVGIELEGYVF